MIDQHDDAAADRQAAVNKAAWRARHPDTGDQFGEPNYHPFVQVGLFIKVVLYDQWRDERRWSDARIGTIYGLRFGTHGLGITFRYDSAHGGRWVHPWRVRLSTVIPRGIVRFGRTATQRRNDGRTA